MRDTEQEAAILVSASSSARKLGLGDIVRADARLLNLYQSTLSRESLPVIKKPGEKVYSESTCKQREIEVAFITTGVHPFFGKVAYLVDSTNQVDHFQQVLTAIGNICICSIGIGKLSGVIVMCQIQHHKYRDEIDKLLVLSVSGIPIVLPTVLSVTMAWMAWMTAIEEMDGMDVLCSDKTRTLALDKLTANKNLTEVFAKGAEKDYILPLAARALRIENQDAIDAAMKGMLTDPKEAQAGIREDHFFSFNLVDKRTTSTYIDSNGNWHRASKGALEQGKLNSGSIPALSPGTSSAFCQSPNAYTMQNSSPGSVEVSSDAAMGKKIDCLNGSNITGHLTMSSEFEVSQALRQLEVQLSLHDEDTFKNYVAVNDQDVNEDILLLDDPYDSGYARASSNSTGPSRQQHSGYDIKELIEAAHTRWLKPAEVLFTLQYHSNYRITQEVLQKPPSGSLFLFNKRVLRFFRKDGHSWRKKKDGRTVGEAHECLKVGNAEALNCYYAHGDVNPSFQRRSYWMLDPAHEHIVLVLYRELTEGKLNSGSNPALSSRTSSAFCQSPNAYTMQNSSPGSVEVSSDATMGKKIDCLNGSNITGNLTLCSESEVSQALRRLEVQLGLDDDDTFKNYAAVNDQDVNEDILHLDDLYDSGYGRASFNSTGPSRQQH